MLHLQMDGLHFPHKQCLYIYIASCLSGHIIYIYCFSLCSKKVITNPSNHLIRSPFMTFFVFVVKNIGFLWFHGPHKKKHPASHRPHLFPELWWIFGGRSTRVYRGVRGGGGGAARVQRHVDGTLRGKDGFPVQLLQLRSEFWYRLIDQLRRS